MSARPSQQANCASGPSRAANLRFTTQVTPAQAVAAWQPVVEVAMAFSAQLVPATDRGLKAQDRVKKAIEDFGSMLEATRSANPAPFDALAAATKTTA